jgi:predicted RNA-binding protein
MPRNYWIDLFTIETWQEFREHGSDVSGFNEKRWTTVQKIKPGDYLLCYLTRASRWVGLLEVISEPFQDDTPIWKSQTYSCRLRVRPLVVLAPEYGVPVMDLREELTVFQGLNNPNRWQGPFRGSPGKWKTADGEAIVRALQNAEANPKERPLGRLAASRPRPQRKAVATDGAALVPEDDVTEAADETGPIGTTHTEIQYLLLKLGSDMGFSVHVASNDQSRQWKGQALGDMPRRREKLPQQFDPVTNRTIELIDVLWLNGNSIEAAFEVESTTSIYSGLLRMSDLLARQPNISVPLFLVAPESRREEVVRQVNRPTFANMEPPLVDVCRYISFEGLREELEAAKGYVSFLKPAWLQNISESCTPDEDL